ncbi:MAG TPA: hypothetical protein V6D46_04125 [Coleofasciculaceae cyanobacterium]
MVGLASPRECFTFYLTVRSPEQQANGCWAVGAAMLTLPGVNARGFFDLRADLL